MKIRTTTLFLFVSVACLGQGKFFGGNGDGFASATISNVVLPLQVISFSVVKQDAVVKASLQITSDETVCKIILEKSSNAVTYQAADILENPAGLQGSHFLFTDSSSLASTNYYRARIFKCNGGIVFTAVITVSGKEDNGSFYYSQLSGTIHYTILNDGKIEIINTAGQLVYQTSIYKGSGIIYFVPATKGIYLLRFEDKPAVKILIE